MTASDQATLAFYSAEATAYATRGKTANLRRLSGFMAALPRSGKVLELGCGSGHDSQAMIASGFDVTPTDGTPELAREAERLLGRPVRVLLFHDLDARDAYDGVWASACLLHVPRAELAGVLARIHAALKPGGMFYASFKKGEEDGRDSLDRYFNYPSIEWLKDAYGQRPWRSLEIEESRSGRGYNGETADWLHVTAKKAA
ncbi:MAG: SAM-dependent methyltransferase [Rhizobiales bacterium 65-9]|nr:class I SAM-dependent methyltransferase [Hyphomicrobiales bacterium]OJY35427.1 MAG: SAM-dependent methyltransferase [Rhizobiales bacterium 65-9]